jgi:hypothetical protein
VAGDVEAGRRKGYSGTATFCAFSHLLSQKFLIPCSNEHHVENMTATRKFQPSSIKNKIKREDEARKLKRSKRQDKLQRRLALAKAEANDPAAKKVSTLTFSFPIITEKSIVGTSSQECATNS